MQKYQVNQTLINGFFSLLISRKIAFYEKQKLYLL